MILKDLSDNASVGIVPPVLLISPNPVRALGRINPR